MGPLVDGANHFVDGIVGQNRQQRSKDFLLHHVVPPGDPVKDGGFNFQGFGVCPSTKDSLSRIHQIQDPQKMFFIDDMAIILIFQGTLAKLGADLPDQLFYEPVFHPDIAENVVGSHAGLSAVQKLAEDDAPGRRMDIRGTVHDAGTLSAQLQGHRSQVRGGLLHDEAAHRFAAGEKDIVEMLFQQRCVFRPSPGYDSHLGRREISRNQTLHQAAGVNGVGAGL